VKTPRIAVPLPDAVRKVVEAEAKRQKRTVSNLAAWIIEQWAVPASEMKPGRLPKGVVEVPDPVLVQKVSTDDYVLPPAEERGPMTLMPAVAPEPDPPPQPHPVKEPTIDDITEDILAKVQPFPEGLNTPAVRRSFREWVRFRIGKKRPANGTWVDLFNLQIGWLSKYPPDQIVASMDDSRNMGSQILYGPPKK